MKRYIKTNLDGFIIDIFFEHQKGKFDGKEILLDDVTSPADVWINNKCIFDELGNPLFKYLSGKVSEVPATFYSTQHEQARKQKRINAIMAELDSIDSQSVRPLRAKLANTATQADTDKLNQLESQAANLREEYNRLKV